MIKLQRLTYIYLYVMILSPIVYYLFRRFTGQSFELVYMSYSIFYGLFYVVSKKNLYVPKYLYLLFAYMVYLWFMFYTRSSQVKGVFYNIHSDKLMLLTSYFFIIIIYNTVFTDKFIMNIVKIAKVTVVVAAIVSTIQVFRPGFFNPYTQIMDLSKYSIYEIRRPSIFGYSSSNEIGLAFFPLVAVVIGYMLTMKNKIIPVYVAMSGIVAFLTNSRYVIIAFGLSAISLYLSSRSRVGKAYRYVIVLFMIGFVVYNFLGYLGYNFGEYYNARLFVEGDIEKSSRYVAIEMFLKFFPQAPLFGIWDYTYDIVNEIGGRSVQIHIGYLAHLVLRGIFGSFFLFGFWYLILKKFYQTAKITHYWGSVIGFSLFLWANMTLVAFSISNFGLMFTFVFDKYFHDKYNIRQL